MNKPWMLMILGALLVADGLVTPARAQSYLVYATEYNQPTNHFGTINLLNGNFAKIASIGSAKINDIAYCPTNGLLYGISNSTVLVTFNQTNGAITKVANLSTNNIESLAFRPSDGKLFGATQSRLYTINPVTGTATSVGNYGSPRNLNSAGQNIRFAQDGNLYVSNTGTNTDIYRINITNGAATWMGEAVGYPYLMLMNASSNMYGVFVNLGSVSNTYPELASFDFSSFVSGGTNANGSTHQISLTQVGAGTNFPANVVFSGNVPPPVTNLTIAVSATGPVSQTVCPGDGAVFSTVASGTGPYSYAWLENGSVLSGQTNRSLTLVNVGAGDAATYSVIVSGVMGTVTNSAALTVNSPVTVTTVPLDQISVAGGSATFGVTAGGTGLSYQWWFNGQVIGTSANLILNNLLTSQAGIYTVIVSGTCGSVTNSANLTVNKAAALIALGSLNQTYNGSAEPATVTTIPSGLAVTFTFNGSSTVPKNAGSYTVVGTINDPNYQGSATGTLVIAPAALTITAAANTKTYDGTTNAAAVPTVTGLHGFDTVTGLAEAYTTKNVGTGKTLAVNTYTVNDGNGGANYTVNTVSSSAGEIDPATLTVTANNKSKMCGLPNPALTASYSGFISGEDTNVLTSPAVLNTTATINSAVGAYPITASGAAAANYAVNYNGGTLTVGVAPVVQLSCARVNVSGTSQFVVSWLTSTNQNYQLECTTNLAAPAWAPVGSSLPGTGAALAVTNGMGATPQCFFRVELQ
jgi:hypothetical protein